MKPLGDQPPVGRIEGAGIVLAVLDVGGIGGADQGDAHFLGDREEGVLHHFQHDGIDADHPSVLFMTMLPMSSTRASKPGSTTVVAPASWTTAGPWKWSPAKSSRRR